MSVHTVILLLYFLLLDESESMEWEHEDAKYTMSPNS